MVHLGVELDAVEPPALVSNGNVGAGVGVGLQGEALRDSRHIVAVAHPGNPLGRQAVKELAAGVIIGDGFAVLPGGVVLGRRDPSAQGVAHELAAVADAQNGHAPGEDGRIHVGGVLFIDAVRAAGEDDADGIFPPELLQRGGVGVDLAVNAALPDPPGDELVVLAAEVQDDDQLIFHG